LSRGSEERGRRKGQDEPDGVCEDHCRSRYGVGVCCVMFGRQKRQWPGIISACISTVRCDLERISRNRDFENSTSNFGSAAIRYARREKVRKAQETYSEQPKQTDDGQGNPEKDSIERGEWFQIGKMRRGNKTRGPTPSFPIYTSHDIGDRIHTGAYTSYRPDPHLSHG
jgi:hypothetical protein